MANNLHFHVTVVFWAFIPLSLFFFFLNHKVSLYLLAFSKLQLPGVVRECVRHGIARNRLGLYTEKKTKTKATRSWVYPERNILGCHLCTPTLNLPPLGCLWRGLTKVLCSGGRSRWGYWVPTLPPSPWFTSHFSKLPGNAVLPGDTPAPYRRSLDGITGC